MRIRLFTEGDREQWDRYVDHSSSSACYHLIGWKDVIERSFGHKTFYLLAENSENEVKGILPLVNLKSFMFGNFMVSLPYLNYGGICSEDSEIQDLLLKEAIKIAEREKVEHIELRHTTNVSDKLPVKTSKVTMKLGLPSNPEELWKSFSSNLRRKIRRPTKEGFYWRLGREEELDGFYTIFAANMRDLGTPVYAKKFFQNILREFPKLTWICTVKTKEHKPIASAFLFGFKDSLEIPWVSSLRSYNHYYPNLLLYWNILKFACESSYKVFDFGRSTVGEGTYKFKEQWGAKPVQLYWHYWVKKGRPLPELNPDNPKYRSMIFIWQRLPVSLTKLIGPPIVKNLP